MRFAKLSGAGNDFVLLEGRVRKPGALARRLCDRREGVGADGLLIVERAPKLKLSYFNADGSEAFCGNGSRCAAWWMHRRGWAGGEFSFSTSEGALRARVTGENSAAIRMPPPKVLKLGLTLKVLGRTLTADWLDTGVPHAVIAVKDLPSFPVVELGRAVRRHKAFGAPGANADFVTCGRKEVGLRTYERGVEDETLACGTGAVAAAVAAFLAGRVKPPVRVRVKSRQILTVRFSSRGGAIEDVWLEGPAQLVFQGETA